jgi:Domain of unknown function (DUF4861)
MKRFIGIVSMFIIAFGLYAQQGDWYSTKGDFNPEVRLVFKIKNTLDIERKNYPVAIERQNFPFPDEYPMSFTIVDPSLPPYEGPSKEVLALYGGHQLTAETNGHALFRQFDDLDKDGIWDELFFQVDLEPNEEKTIYVYVGENIQGWNKHLTHTNIGSYGRREMPFWESENVGWKMWFDNCCDVYAKRKPVLMADRLYMENYDGYAVDAFNPDWGSDIQKVAETMGGGAICLFEYPDHPDSVSLPRFTPTQKVQAEAGSLWNAGPISDTRYAFEVISNGPVRSIMKVKTMNWNTVVGSYEVEQYYTAYGKQSYSTCSVQYKNFDLKTPGVMMGCGIRRKPEIKEELYQKGGIVISSGPEQIKDPENIDDREELSVDFVGKALVVKDQYKPEYQYTENYGGNHTLRVTPDAENRYEYMIFAAWSEGAVYTNQEDFEAYVKTTALEFNNPAVIDFIALEKK